jgi:hypothetical protein
MYLNLYRLSLGISLIPLSSWTSGCYTFLSSVSYAQYLSTFACWNQPTDVYVFTSEVSLFTLLSLPVLLTYLNHSAGLNCFRLAHFSCICSSNLKNAICIIPASQIEKTPLAHAHLTLSFAPTPATLSGLGQWEEGRGRAAEGGWIWCTHFPHVYENGMRKPNTFILKGDKKE